MFLEVQPCDVVCPLCGTRLLECPVTAYNTMNTSQAKGLRDLEGGHLLAVVAPAGGPANGIVRWLVECQSPNRRPLGPGVRPLAKVDVAAEVNDEGRRVLRQRAASAAVCPAEAIHGDTSPRTASSDDGGGNPGGALGHAGRDVPGTRRGAARPSRG